MIVVLLAGVAMAADLDGSDPNQPTSAQQMAFEYDNYFYFAPEQEASESPSDAPPPPPAEDDADDACAVACDECCGSCCRSCCGSGIVFGGWLDQGFTANPDDPANRFNGPVTFNDRSNEYQLNQLYLYAEREAYTGGYGWDIGGRVDVFYGTDSRFTLARGLDDDWSNQRFYGPSMPQLYLDVAYNDLTVRMGHFYTILGYESVMAPENFFYSHAYTMQYGEPFTHTGLLAMYDLNDCWAVSGGFTRGWNNWYDNNNDLDFLGGVTWTSWDEGTSLAFAINTGNEDDAGVNNRTVYSLVFSKQLTDRMEWVLQHDLGNEEGVGLNGGEDARWYGINTYLFYEINRNWSFGVRYEWFNDQQGTRVDAANAAGGPPRGMALNGVPTNWYEVTAGVRWTPRNNLIVRSECRWDWCAPHGNAQIDPFDDGTKRRQFLWSIDAIVTF
jgi:hypothetical protein